MELIKINVTQQDIKDGSKKSCFDCAIAYSICRIMKLPYREVSIAETIRIRGCLQNIEIPKWLQKWIISYDKGLNVNPIEFYILKKRMPLEWEIITEK